MFELVAVFLYYLLFDVEFISVASKLLYNFEGRVSGKGKTW
jgi:hypothetical protein